MKTKRKTKGAKPNRQRRFAEARGYTATEAQLAEIALLECCIFDNATEVSRVMSRMQRCAANLNEIRRKIREAV